MTNINTIILKKGYGEITDKGDAVWGIDSEAVEVKRWDITQEEEARAELAKYRCEYCESRTFAGNVVTVATEYALEFCECDEDGDFIQGSDFELAAEA